MQEGCELTEQQNFVSAVRRFEQKFLEQFHFCRLCHARILICRQKSRIAADLAQTQQGAEHFDP